ncbi:MAG: hypothetical protein ABWY77_06720 [Acidimicrobiia bacterium]
MSDNWETVGAGDVQVGDRIRYRGSEFTVARIDDRFLGRDEMLCFIEDTPQRWHAYPGPAAGEVEVLRGS